MGLLLGIDLGTTGCKAGVYDQDGHLLGESYLEYGLITLSPTMIEQDAHAWWQLTCQAIEQALEGADALRSAVRGLAVSSQGISFVLLDKGGNALGNAINWLDHRALEESEMILERYSQEELFTVTGKRASPFYVLPKLLWLQKHRPDVWRRVHKVLMGHDYLVYRFCGETVTDHSMAGGTMLYDLRALEWSTELLDVFGIPREILPAICWSGTPVGTLRSDVARELGLPSNVVVSVGGQDQKCAALGAGIQDGKATLSLGTASAISQVMDRPHVDVQMRVPTFTFVVPNRWVLEGVVSTGAGSLRWYRDTICPGTPYSALDEEAAQIPPGADGVFFYPHLSGAGSPHWKSQSRGTFHGLSLATTRAHLTRAILEGIAYQMRENLAVTEELAGPVEEAIVFGGGAKSALWREIIGDVINRPLAWTQTVETANIGAAMLAGVGSGLFSTLAQAREVMVGELAHRDPVPKNVEIYAQRYEEYRRIESVLVNQA
ncbi:MAG: xylulokinase [Chloroflexi bacterium]|nr:xylulokinase [Chloroflexota bacterium]